MSTDYSMVTEISGDLITYDQLQRLCNRYYWAGAFCRGKRVLEAACGTGPGLGYIYSLATHLEAGDYTQSILDIARHQYRDRIPLHQFDAQEMPFHDSSFDILIIFEAIYYIPDLEKFTKECKRVLDSGGCILIATANKDLSDFNPSPFSHTYLGAKELHDFFSNHGFRVDLYGDTPIAKASVKQRVLRTVKKAIVSAGLMPKSMAGKKILKRLVFGKLVPMPHEIEENSAPRIPPTPIPGDRPDRTHKVIFCAATLHDQTEMEA